MQSDFQNTLCEVELGNSQVETIACAALLLATSSSSLSLSRLELSDTEVYEPQMRALHGTALQLCEVLDIRSKTVRLSGRNNCMSGAAARNISFFIITLEPTVE